MKLTAHQLALGYVEITRNGLRLWRENGCYHVAGFINDVHRRGAYRTLTLARAGRAKLAQPNH